MRSINSDVTVVGSGLLGLATAFELIERDLTVTIVGPRAGRHRGQASRAAGAMLTVFSEVESRHPDERVTLEVGERLAAREVYPDWLERISSAVGRSLPLLPGVWVIANGYGRDDGTELRAIAAAAQRHGRRAEFATAADVTGLSPQVRAHEALWLPDEASVDPIAVLDALATALHAHPQCRWIDASAIDVREMGNHLVVKGDDGSDAWSAHLVLAAGAGVTRLLADSDLAQPVAAPPLRSGRGVSLVAAVGFALPSAIRTPNRGFACGSHLVPRGDGLVYLGATNRLSTDPNYEAAPNLDEIATLVHDGAAELNVGLTEAQLVDIRVGHRPVTFDHLPLLGRTGHPMVHLATGTYRCGVLLAPRAASLVADGITHPGTHDAHPYSPLRPMRTPGLEEFLDDAAGGLVEMICQPGGQLPPGADAQLARFLRAALSDMTASDSVRAAAIRRVWERAPMPECVPLLLDVAGRLR